MGTRSLTFVYDERGDAIINLYRQYDGYPSGHGAELAEFLAGKRIVNGLAGDTSMVFNGMGCLAASLVANFKRPQAGFISILLLVRTVGRTTSITFIKIGL